MSDDYLMHPESTPSVLASSGVRRVNNLPLYLAIIGATAFLLIIAGVAYKRGDINNKTDGVDEKPPQTMNSSELASNVLSRQSTPPITLPLREQVQTEIKPAVENKPVEPPKPAAPPMPQVQPVDQDKERLKQLKMQQFEEAVRAKTEIAGVGEPGSFFASASPSSRGNAQTRLDDVRQKIAQESIGGGKDAKSVYLEKLRAANDVLNTTTGGGKSGGNIPASLTAGENNSLAKNDSIADGQNKEDRWYLGSQVEAPTTPYLLRAGTVIPGVMISGVNSELPGQLLAQVSQDVWDTATGKIKLLPQGTKLFGSYSSDVIYGQQAVLVAWQRLTFPDGKVLDIGAMPGADEAGYAGFRDKVDHHYLRTFGSAFLMSAIVGGVALSQQNSQNTNPGGFGFQQNSTTTLSQILGQQLGQVTSQLIAKNLNIAPTIEIRPGYSFNVIATKDIIFPSEYRQFDY